MGNIQCRVIGDSSGNPGKCTALCTSLSKRENDGGKKIFENLEYKANDDGYQSSESKSPKQMNENHFDNKFDYKVSNS